MDFNIIAENFAHHHPHRARAKDIDAIMSNIFANEGPEHEQCIYDYDEKHVPARPEKK